MVIRFGRYGLFVWPLWYVADMVSGRYGTDPLQLHQCLPLPRKRSPDGASRKDERLSRPGWLTNDKEYST